MKLAHVLLCVSQAACVCCFQLCTHTQRSSSAGPLIKTCLSVALDLLCVVVAEEVEFDPFKVARG